VRSISAISFPPFELDPVNQCLWRDQQVISLRPKAYAVLHYLVERPGQLVTKEELLGAVWPESFAGDAVLKVSIGEVRKALQDDSEDPDLSRRLIGEAIGSSG
jgi:DNA-binding winged helix-turn-helix (wHTH) protein